MLTVNIEQIFTRIAHLLQRGATPINETTRTSVCIQHPAQQAYIRITYQLLLAQPALQIG